MILLARTDTVPPALEPEAVRRRYLTQIDAALTRQLYEGSRLPTLLMLLSGLTCAGLLWDAGANHLLAPLLLWLTLLVGLRLWQTSAFERADPERQALPQWRCNFLLGAAASGSTLALVGVLLMPLATPLQQALVYGLLAAAIIASSVVYAASLRAFLAFAVPGLLPSSLYLLGGPAAHWGAFGLMLLCALSLSAWQVSRVTHHNLLRRFQNQALIEHLEQSRHGVESLNDELAREVGQRREAEAQLRKTQAALEELVSERTRELGASERARREEESRRRYLTSHDQLTGLANRTLLLQRVEEATQRVRQGGRSLALLHLDLDRFQLLNDSLGHEIADDVLREMARRLSASVREADTIARLSVDEFAVLLEGRFGADELEQLASRVLGTLRRSLMVGEHELLISASLGIALLPETAGDPAALVSQANMAMQRAKQLGGNCLQFFSEGLRGCTRERLLLEAQLDKALERGQLEVFYQPKLVLAHNRLLGAEALVRWRHPEFGLVSPASFISLAEETGQIVAIGEFVLRQACRQACAWHALGLDWLRVSVNISMHQLRKGDFVELVAAVLAETGLPPAQLELELTETQLSDDVSAVAELFRRLRALGVRLAIDDFGTGYSSLGYLKHLPVDVLKIDQAFIRELDGSDHGGDAAIARAIIVMAHSLGLEVVAEGVEETTQLEFLRTHGCDEIQGYLISRPVPADSLAELLRAQAA
ncbi:diguanylate cyclase (GGDEF) domain-containing protein [Geopseudomonas guangdongensis]|uniref:cyclic-guanylate-specific phosphodiesterase n=1 Tax=Geopseudomonas guangdongensis TaxID=1245526 RepID=A0A1H2F6C3_9GAMM|nr:bifunctional diguanylate cyclase/phosphodiesterase [Pseudomonas guangdongensis]SDU02877.1 diguanylate cyclase (GGDEF) domain-containing protein [Pseudomonas guangdongensis]